MCHYHIKRLASAVNLTTNNIPTNEMIIQITKCSQNTASLKEWDKGNINSRHQARWFRHGKADSRAKINVLFPFRNAIVNDTPFIIPNKTFFLKITKKHRKQVVNNILRRLDTPYNAYDLFHRREIVKLKKCVPVIVRI